MLRSESCICGGIFDLDDKKKQLADLEKQMAEPTFWDDNERAQKLISDGNVLKVWIVPYDALVQSLDDLKALLPEASDLGDEALIEELERDLKRVDKELSELETRRMLSGELDNSDCYLSINSGAGGTEACDWALMLSRMYQRWAQRRKYTVSVVDSVDGDVAGVKSITLKISGPFAYGYAKAERGVHRLVRISPFDSGARRHTSFASVEITPEISDEIEVDLNPADIRVDTFRSSGAGGQHVNTTDSAVRMTHTPTNIVVSCQQERSQIKNRETCMKMLRAKLYEKQIEERKSSLDKIGGEKKEIAWGSQVRNYVFQPYTLVKDTRTGYEVGNIEAMMDGELLDGFIIAYLKEQGT